MPICSLFRQRLHQLGRLAVYATVSLLTHTTGAQPFTTVINLPPDPLPDFIASDTQVNISAGGTLPDDYIAGAADGSTSNVEVNVDGGALGEGITIPYGSTLNMQDGKTGGFLVIGGELNLYGGFVGTEDFDPGTRSFAAVGSGVINAYWG